MRPTDRTRAAAVAGYFYPADPDALHAAVVRYLDQAIAPPAEIRGRCPKALIVPHAGYPYSGPIAGSAYALVRPFGAGLRRIVLLGPAHRVHLRGLAASTATAFDTPLGEVKIDGAAIDVCSRLPAVSFDDAAHIDEHSLEVQLPFLKTISPQARLVPLAVGVASTEDVASVLDVLWGTTETLVVVSSDLSHYWDYATARRLDAQTSEAIVGMTPDTLGPDSACGRYGIRGLLRAAAMHHLRGWLVDLRNSGDTAGGRDEVVGYGAYAFL